MAGPSAVAAADAITFQRWLHARQYPQDCSQTVGVHTRQDYFYALGLGAQMVSLKFNFLDALLTGRVYHFPTSHYVNPLRCPSRKFDCYFALPTNCSADSAPRPAALHTQPRGRFHRAVEDSKIHWCFDLPRRRLSRLAGLHRVHAKAWYHAQLAAFLFRPNDELIDLGRELLANMEGSLPAPSGGGGGGGGGGGSSGRLSYGRVRTNGSACVAMHIRRTDKHTEDHRTAQRSFNDFAQVFKSWGYWSHTGAKTALRAFLGSEDKATFR
jgi:hypothetical protein